MRGLRVARVTVIAAIVAAAAAAPAGAQPADEPIEMDPEPAAPKSPPPPPKDPAATDPAAPPTGEPAAPVKDPKAAKKWLAAGQQLVAQGDWFTRAKKPDDAKARYENAVTSFQKSIDAGDDLNTYALLADAEEKLGKIDIAARHYRVVVKAQAGIRPDVLKKSTTKLEELSGKLGILTLTVNPEGAQISLSGTELGKAPLAEPLILVPGPYMLSFQADGFQPKDLELTIEAGSENERTIDLEAVKIIVRPPAPKIEEPPPKVAAGPSRLPIYVSAGAGVALLGTAAVTGFLAIRQHGTYTAEGSTGVEREDARINGKRLALVSDLTLVGGLAAGGFAAYWYFFKYKPAQRKPAEERPMMTSASRGRRDAAQSAKVDLIPWVQPGASGLSLAGAF
jgi:hypothetical protein